MDSLFHKKLKRKYLKHKVDIFKDIDIDMKLDLIIEKTKT